MPSAAVTALVGLGGAAALAAMLDRAPALRAALLGVPSSLAAGLCARRHDPQNQRVGVALQIWVAEDGRRLEWSETALISP